MEIFHDIEQGSDQWRACRAGLVTASNFKLVMAKGEGKTRKAYMHRLAAEIITGEPLESFSSPAMARGNAMESEARDYFAFRTDFQLTRVGFIRNGQKGCSPDSLIGGHALLEIKTQRGDLLIETLLKNEVPSEHKAQIQGQLWVAERDVCYLIVYWPGMPPFIRQIRREPLYIAELSDAVDRFNDELSAVVERIKSYGLREQEAA
jgi:predicted phage-related endonuclease